MISSATQRTPDVWARIAAPLPAGVVQWRQDGRPMSRDGKFFARFVAYIDAQFVRERLDECVPGEWDLTLELLPAQHATDDTSDAMCSFKARLQVLGVIREDVGQGSDYKQASTDAFKRAAVRFGIGAELYDYGMNWVQVDGDGKYAKPLEDPTAAYARRNKTTGGGAPSASPVPSPRPVSTPAPSAPASVPATPAPVKLPEQLFPNCPKCGSAMWDNRASKTNPKAPDFKCKDRACDGAVWPKRDGERAPATTAPRGERTYTDDDFPLPLEDEQDGLPF